MPKLLDLFCGAGGAAMGYCRAGWDVVGVDIAPQKHYPFAFYQADALTFLALHWRQFDAVHASPPCKRFSAARRRNRQESNHPDLLTPKRQLLQDLGVRLWVIENVESAPMRPPAIRLCGLMFGLKLFRHRWFESVVPLMGQPHIRHGDRRVGKDGFVSVFGHGDYSPGNHTVAERKYQPVATWREAMGIDWMTRAEISQAIPPAYTEYVGRQLIRFVEDAA